MGALLLTALLAGTAAAAGELHVVKIALEGDAAPAAVGGSFGHDFFAVDVNDAGDVGFFGPVTGGSANFAGFVETGGVLTLRAAAGGAAPGVGGTYIAFGAIPNLNLGGDLSFLAFVAGGSTNRALFVEAAGGGTAAVVPGDPAPGTGGTYAATGSAFSMHSMNDAGAVAFHAEVAVGTTARGLFVSASGGDTAVALEGDAAPGGGTWDTFDFPSISDSGAVSFIATLAGGPAANGLFRGAGATTAIAHAGDAAPGTGGGTFLDFLFPVTNDAGDTVYLANVSGGSATGGIFLASGGSQSAVAVENGVAPGTGGGTYTSVGLLDIDAAGNVVFPAAVSGGSVSGGVFLRRASGVTEPALLTGETAPDSGGATFDAFGFAAINDAGAVAVQATLSDGRNGIFLAAPAPAVPALPPIGLAALAALVLLVAAGVFRRTRASAL